MGGRLVVVRNILKLWALLAALCAVLGGLGWVLDGYRGVSILVFCGLLLALGVYWYADRAVLGLVRARESPAGEFPGVQSTLERLAAMANVAKPKLYVIPDGLPRALAAGRGPGGSSIAVSHGLLQALPPSELEGVLAHEIAHVRHRDVLVQCVAAEIAAVMVETSRIAGWFARAFLWVLGPVAAAFVHLLLSPKREFEADRAAAHLCGTPHGLVAALIRLEEASELVQFQGSPAAEPLYTINPFEEHGLAGLFATHPATAERVRRLRALDSDGLSDLEAA